MIFLSNFYQNVRGEGLYKRKDDRRNYVESSTKCNLSYERFFSLGLTNLTYRPRATDRWRVEKTGASLRANFLSKARRKNEGAMSNDVRGHGVRELIGRRAMKW